MNNDLIIGDTVIVETCINDPVAEEYLNDHAIILELRPPYAKVQFLNNDIHTILLSNLRKHSN